MNLTPKAAAFLNYWQQYRDIADIQAQARRNALRDSRAIICLNDVEAAWAKLVGPMHCD